ncbi:MAG: glycine dehydrogenase (aminomethyl-transferring) [SAR202 cluster bacterium Io17-Chloro-G3]|nr:MAG: glycine dehydrogenase (aminomethyl-transferring) [SAR202 cluster bacterium Io17-Chloro-G3]
MTSPYSPNTPEDRSEMLQAIGVTSIQELFGDIPVAYRDSSLAIPPPLSEMELSQELELLASENQHSLQTPCFLGGGAYNHYVPAAVRAIASRGEFLTSYTPYQPEVSQGTLQAAYEFQSLTCQLLGMDVANAGLYDGATSLAEAALMACRITKRYRVACLDSLSPTYREVVETYTQSQGIELYTVRADTAMISEDTACLLVQHPNLYGYLEDVGTLADWAHAVKALLVVSTDPVALGLFRSPGEYGADIVTAEGQSLGIPMSFGGPYIGLFACKMEFVRQMPGRIVGRTLDDKDRIGYVLTLQTREQHIRRERATSNVCTSQQLIGLMATIYLALLGPRGLRQVAELCYQKAHYAASLIERIPGYSLPFPGTFFQEFLVECPRSPFEINSALLERGIIGGVDVSDLMPNCMVVCVTEQNSRGEIEALARALSEIT